MQMLVAKGVEKTPKNSRTQPKKRLKFPLRGGVSPQKSIPRVSGGVVILLSKPVPPSVFASANPESAAAARSSPGKVVTTTKMPPLDIEGVPKRPFSVFLN